VIAFLWAVAGILLGGAFTFLATRLQLRHQNMLVERQRLLEVRTDSFRRLWKVTGHIPQNPEAVELRAFRAREVVTELNRWYFDDGGMFLTAACRSDYFNLVEKLQPYMASKPMTSEAYPPIYEAASKLRETLAKELDARTSIQGGKI
jgi:hypothetical protein